MPGEEDDTSPRITVYPPNFQSLERFEEDGTEVPEREFSAEELFARSVQQLQQDYRQTKKKRKTHATSEESSLPEEDTDDTSWMDPRIHYRPMVVSLQAANAELNQMINVIDLTRGKQYLEEGFCRREDAHPKTRDLQLLLENSSEQVANASKLLLQGADNLIASITKERKFFQSVVELLGRWRVISPLHGSNPKPFRAGEMLAIDCSLRSAGSAFEHRRTAAGDVSHVMIERTAEGYALATLPEIFLQQTLRLQVESSETGERGAYSPDTPTVPALTKLQLDALTGSESHQQRLKAYNRAVVHAVQHSVHCEEIFQVLMNEGIHPNTNWVNGRSEASCQVSVIHILDNEIKIRIDDQHTLTVWLAVKENDLSEGSHSTKEAVEETITPTTALLQRAAKMAMSLLQVEVRNSHFREPSSQLALFNTEGQTSECSPLIRLGSVVSHMIVKEQVRNIIDRFAALSCVGDRAVPHAPKLIPASICQPYCDTLEGIYLKAKWKTLKPTSIEHLNRSCCDIIIGKNYFTQIFITGQEISSAPAGIAHYGPLAAGSQKLNGINEFEQYLRKLIESQIAESLFRDARSMGIQRVAIDEDHMTVRIYSAGEWDGSSIGDDKVLSKITCGCIVLKPYYSPESDRFLISCNTFGLGLTPELDRINSRTEQNGPALDGQRPQAELNWADVPGYNDSSKLEWVLNKVQLIRPIRCAK